MQELRLRYIDLRIVERSFFFNITEQQLRDLVIPERKKQYSKKIAMQKADSLCILESMFNQQLRKRITRNYSVHTERGIYMSLD